MKKIYVKGKIFNIVVKPNDWAKAMRSNDSSSASQLFNMDLWEEFKNYAENDEAWRDAISYLL